MATRLYLPSSGAAAVSPAYDSNWSDTSSADRIKAVRIKSSTALTDKAVAYSDNPAVSPWILLRMYVTDPIGVVNFNGTTMSAVIRCLVSSTTNTAAKLQFLIRLYHQDATFTTLLNNTDVDSTWGTSAATRIANAVALSNVTSQNGDRIVIEIAASKTGTATTSRTYTERFGDAAASDFALTSALTTDLNPWVEFSATIPYGSPLTAALSFSGSVPKKTITSRLATASFSGSLPRSIIKLLPSTLSFVSDLTKRLTKSAMTAAMSFVGTTTKSIAPSAKTGTVSFSGSQTRNILHLLSATLSSSGTRISKTLCSLTGGLSLLGTTGKRVTRSISAGLGFVGNLASELISGVIAVTFTATLALSGNTRVAIRKLLQATLSSSTEQNRKTLRSLFGSLGLSGQSSIFLLRLLTGNLSFSAAMSKMTSKILSATLSFIGSSTKRIAENLAAALSFVGLESFLTNKRFVASFGLSGAITKGIARGLAAAIGFQGALNTGQAIIVNLLASLGFSGTTSRSTRRGLSANLGSSGEISRRTNKGLLATIGFTTSAQRSIAKRLSSSVQFVGDFRKRMSALFASALTFVGDFRGIRIIIVVFTAAISFSTGFRRAINKELLSSLVFDPGMRRAIAKKLTISALYFVGRFQSTAIAKIIRLILSKLNSSEALDVVVKDEPTALDATIDSSPKQIDATITTPLTITTTIA